MRSNLLRALALLALVVLSGCEMLRSKPAEPTNSGAPPVQQHDHMDVATRNNALALLDDLLNDEKNLSKILIVKRNSDELGKLVEKISKTARDGAKALERWTKHDTNLNYKELSLPPGEKATRDAIGKAKEKLLLHSKDEEFEFQLLLTQIEALNYGTFLAQVAAENEPQADRAKELSALSAQLRELREEVVAMVRTRRN